MKNILFLFLSLAILSSCKKDEETITNAVITVKNGSNSPVSGMTVYAYTQSTWSVSGDNSFFADGQASSDSEGKAVFSNLEYPAAFMSTNNNQNNFRFSAHYSLNGVNKKKSISITFNKGDEKTGAIILN